MGSEKFCLRWNDFESNISVAFRELREDKDFFDVTLACDDEQIQAHKVILSACSPFFRTVLRRNPHAHPLLYLKGVKYSDLQSVLNFMYHGEVNVAQEELNSFLAVAEELRVKGLTQNQSGGSKTDRKDDTYAPPGAPRPSHRPAETHRPVSREPPAPPPPKKPRPPAQSVQQLDDDIQEVPPTEVKTEPASHQPTTGHQQQQQQQQQQQEYAGGELQHVEELQYEEGGYEDYGDYGAEGGYDGALMVPGDGSKGGEEVPDVTVPEDLLGFCVRDHEGQSRWTCSLCYQFSHKSRQNVRNHVESRHYPTAFQYSCPVCAKLCSTMRALEVHKSSAHRNIGFLTLNS